MKMNKKLLFLVNVDWFFISHRLPIAIKAISQGYEVHIACEFTDNKELLERLGLIVHRVPFSRNGRCLLKEVLTLLAIYNIFREIKPDLVHAVTIKPVLYGGLIARITGIKSFVGAVSGLGLVFVASDLKTKIIRIFVKYLYRLSFKHSNMKAIFQNHVDKRTLLDVNVVEEENAIIIKGSGADLFEYKYKEEPDSVPIVIMACRLLREKGVLDFISMARMLKDKNINAKFILVGEPDYGNPNSFTVEDLAIWKKENFVEVYGFSAHICKLFSNSHIVVLPSYYGEGLPKVLIEAAACGRPIVTTDNPGCMEAVIDNKTGFIVPARDIKSLALAVEKLISNPKLRQKMGKAARIFAEKEFDVNSVVEKHMNIYRELLNK